MIRLGKDPDKKKKSYRKKQNRNLGQNGTALEAIEKVVQERKISTKINYDVLKNLTMAASGRTMNDMGGGPDAEPTAATLSPKNEPHATTEKAVKGEKEDESNGSNSSKSRGEPPAKRPRQHSQGPNLLVRGGGRVNNQSKQKQAGVGEGSEKKSPADGEVVLPVDEPVVEEGPVEPEAQEEDLSDLEDDEDDRMLSAAELLGGYGEEEEEEYY